MCIFAVIVCVLIFLSPSMIYNNLSATYDNIESKLFSTDYAIRTYATIISLLGILASGLIIFNKK